MLSAFCAFLEPRSSSQALTLKFCLSDNKAHVLFQNETRQNAKLGQNPNELSISTDSLLKARTFTTSSPASNRYGREKTTKKDTDTGLSTCREKNCQIQTCNFSSFLCLQIQSYAAEGVNHHCSCLCNTFWAIKIPKLVFLTSKDHQTSKFDAKYPGSLCECVVVKHMVTELPITKWCTVKCALLN